MEQNKENQKQIVEAVIFLSGGSVTRKELLKKINIKATVLEEIIIELKDDYQNRGICLSDDKNSIGFYTNPIISEKLQIIDSEEMTGPLSKSAKETLTTIAYCSPIKKIDIDFIRGVNTQFILKRLLLRGLIQKIDTKNSTFSVTLDFLSNMGIDSIEKLPNYEQIRFKMQESLEEIKKIINNDD